MSRTYAGSAMGSSVRWHAERKAETQAPGFRTLRKEIHLIAERIQFSRETENVKAPSVAIAIRSRPCHRRPITRIVCPDIFAFGLCAGGDLNNFERTRSCDVMIAETTATRTSRRLPSGCNSAKPGRTARTSLH